MKRFLFIILFFTVSAVYGQSLNNDGFDLNHLPATVTGQWKFHSGDNPAWADTIFNDSNWRHLDPTQYQTHLPQVSNGQVGWFRLTLNVAPALRGKALALIVNQYGAAEIYFNGVLIRTMGRVNENGANGDNRRSVAEPLTLKLTAAPKQYMAIRYSFVHPDLVIGNGNAVIRASFKGLDSGWDAFFQEVDFYTTRSFVSGCFMLLAILQLAIYLFNRERKVNLYLSLYTFMQFITLSDGLSAPILQSTNWYAFNIAIFNIAAPLDFVFMMMMTFAFFGCPRNRWFKVLVVLCLPVIIIQFFGDNAKDEYILAIYNVLCYVEMIRISVKALKQKKTGARLFLTGIVISSVFFILFNIPDFIALQPFLLVCFELAFAFLIPAIFLSILLAGEFAQNLISLRQRLAEVESLSAQTLQQEIEKQQILSGQNEVLEQKVIERTAELNQSLNDLKVTQTQLIQAEKMASLGELTAGIAHEIQNPLNFVNNFSEVNQEMLDELEEELNKGDINEAKVIAADIRQNEEKISHHGKRADAIVKGMLEHSKAGSGSKELTDINALADEFMRLSYHGLRSKDKSFNADLVTHFNEALPKANISQQDIGRVLLNLFNNAFYAVNEKRKTARPDYKPEVFVTTSSPPLGGRGVVVLVRDNGNGIPDVIKDKIMQPFFTTKPTGEGTGLGLSLSYDIVVKGHGGSISVNTKEGEFTEFVVTLPEG
jgi:two-component system NtrC family sensor kinase